MAELQARASKMVTFAGIDTVKPVPGAYLSLVGDQYRLVDVKVQDQEGSCTHFEGQGLIACRTTLCYLLPLKGPLSDNG